MRKSLNDHEIKLNPIKMSTYGKTTFGNYSPKTRRSNRKMTRLEQTIDDRYQNHVWSAR